MDIPKICPMADRRHEMIPVEKIKVINSRLRDEKHFQTIVQSIENTGLLVPVRVNDKFVARTGLYELICGEGRLIANQRLKRKRIRAEVVTCTRKEAYLESLVENIARIKPATMECARELKRLHDQGWDYEKIGQVACMSAEYARQYIRLVDRGEERLIHGVEHGVFPISFAVLVAQSDDANVQNVLMDAFDRGLVNSGNYSQARRIINARLARQGQKNGRNGDRKKLTVAMLTKDISNVTKAKDSFIREAKTKENRFLTLLMAINTLWRDKNTLTLLREEHLTDRPELVGDYTYGT